MKRFGQIKAYLGGMLTVIALIAMSVPVWGLSTKTLSNVMVGGIKIVVDGQQINPTDANGNTVDPMIYNGTTYLPVRAVASALGKEVYWDGPNYTVYLGSMGGTLDYPTVMLEDMSSIELNPKSTTELTDNYGNRYNSAITNRYGYSLGSAGPVTLGYLLNMKYSRFKATLYIPSGETSDGESIFTIKADGRILYTSPSMSKTSRPEEIDVDITGYNEIELQWSNNCSFGNISRLECCLADAGFYQ